MGLLSGGLPASLKRSGLTIARWEEKMGGGAEMRLRRSGKGLEDLVSGDAVGLMGNTGELTTGPHLHFEWWVRGRAVDPTPWLGRASAWDEEVSGN